MSALLSEQMLVLFAILLMQFLPRLLKRDLQVEEARWGEEKQAETPGLEARQFILSNPNCDGKRVQVLVETLRRVLGG